jgi:hypothetical protein
MAEREYQRRYDQPPLNNPRTVGLQKSKTFGTPGATVHLSWAGEEFSDAMIAAIEAELKPVMDKMKDALAAAAPVGVESGGKETRESRDVYQGGPHSFKEYTSRKPGRLRSTARATTTHTHDRTKVLGFLEIGGRHKGLDIDYALVREMGSHGRRGGSDRARAFLRPVAEEYREEALEAIVRGALKALGDS